MQLGAVSMTVSNDCPGSVCEEDWYGIKLQRVVLKAKVLSFPISSMSKIVLNGEPKLTKSIQMKFLLQ